MITRLPSDNVKITNGQLYVTCNVSQGGAPLNWNYKGKELIDSFPGKGAQAAYEFGQDPTQASCNGPMPSYLATLTGHNLANSYYGREVSLTSSAYTTQLFCPCFWLSHEAIDDAIPDESISGWCTKYNNFLNIPESTWISMGTPIFWQGTFAKPAGMFFMGNEMIPSFPTQWSNRIAKIQAGNVAAKVKISLKNASSDAYAGLLFKRDIAADSNQDAAYNSPGMMFIVNKSGGWGLHQFPGGAAIASGKISAKSLANLKDGGAVLEFRTNTNDKTILQLYCDGTLIQDMHIPVLLGSSFGLIGSCTIGNIQFSERQVFDLNFQLTQIASVTTAGIQLSFELNLTPGSTAVPLYRANLGSCFWNISNMATAYSQYNNGPHDPGLVSPIAVGGIVRVTSPANNFYIDTKFTELVLNGGAAPDAHALLSRLTPTQPITMYNVLSYNANTNPVNVSQAKLVMEIVGV